MRWHSQLLQVQKYNLELIPLCHTLLASEKPKQVHRACRPTESKPGA